VLDLNPLIVLVADRADKIDAVLAKRMNIGGGKRLLVALGFGQ
jgi:hypothetical protein